MAMALPPEVNAIAGKYYAKQSVGFCEFLNRIGIAPSVEACATAQRAYLESKGAIARWYTGLKTYYTVLTGLGAGAGAPAVR